MADHLKLVCVGDGAVGKTCMLISYANNIFPDTYVPTVFDNYNATVLYENKHVSLGLWDTAGQEDYDNLRNLSYSNVDIFLICFSLVDRNSFNNIKEKWVEEIKKSSYDCVFLLVGTKMDLRDDPKTIRDLKEVGEKPITTDEGKRMAKDVKANGYMECSAKTQTGLKAVFQKSIAVCLGNGKGKKGGGGCDKCMDMLFGCYHVKDMKK